VFFLLKKGNQNAKKLNTEELKQVYGGCGKVVVVHTASKSAGSKKWWQQERQLAAKSGSGSQEAQVLNANL